MKLRSVILLLSMVACGKVDGGGGSEGDNGGSTSGEADGHGGKTSPLPPATSGTQGAGPAWLLVPPDNNRATNFERPPVGASRNDLWLDPGGLGNDFFWHWDGKAWAKVPSGSERRHGYEIASAGPGLLWVTGSDFCTGVLLLDADAHTRWFDSAKSCDRYVEQIDATADLLIAIDSEGAYYARGIDQLFPLPGGERTGGVRVVAKNDAWALSPARHFDGTRWLAFATSELRLPADAAFAPGVAWRIDEPATVSPAWAHRGPPIDATITTPSTLTRVSANGPVDAVEGRASRRPRVERCVCGPLRRARARRQHRGARLRARARRRRARHVHARPPRALPGASCRPSALGQCARGRARAPPESP